MEINFEQWLDDELRKRDWSRNKLATIAGISSGTLSNIFLGNRKPGESVCRAIADALGYPPEVVFRAAGLLPPRSENNEMTEKIIHLVSQMDEVDKTDVYQYAELIYRRRKQRNLLDELKMRLAEIPPDQKGEIVNALYDYLIAAGAKRLK